MAQPDVVSGAGANSNAPVSAMPIPSAPRTNRPQPMAVPINGAYPPQQHQQAMAYSPTSPIMDPTQLQMSPPQGYFLARPPGPQAGQYYPVAVPPGMFVAGMSPPPHPAFMHPYAMKSPPQQGYLQQQAMPMGYQQPIRGPQGQGYPLSPNQAQPSQRSQQHPDASAHSQQHHQQHQHHSNSNNEQQRRSASSTPTAGMSGQSADRPASTTQQPAPRDRVESTISDVSSSTAVDRRASTSNGRTGVKNDEESSAYTLSTLGDELSSIEQDMNNPSASSSSQGGELELDEEAFQREQASGIGSGRSLYLQGPHGSVGGKQKKVQPPPGSLCRYFIQGRCWAGDQCRWSHVLPPYYYPVPVGNGPPQFVQQVGMPPYYQGGMQMMVQQQQGMGGGQSPSEEDGGNGRDNGRQGPPGSTCFYWRQGRCRFGNACRFVHA